MSDNQKPDVDQMTPNEQMKYWMTLCSQLDWAAEAEFVSVNESADGKTATIQVRRKI